VALETYWGLLHEVMERAGDRGTVERLPRSAREAGLEIAEADGFIATQDPATWSLSSGPRKRADTSG
jgi:hypothetical protein